MKKQRIHPVPEDIYAFISEDPIRLLKFLGELKVEMPEGTQFMLLCLKLNQPKIELRFYTKENLYLSDYTKCLLKNREDYEFYSFDIDESTERWEMFMPPPVVGLGVKSKLRPGIYTL